MYRFANILFWTGMVILVVNIVYVTVGVIAGCSNEDALWRNYHDIGSAALLVMLFAVVIQFFTIKT